MEPEAKMNKSKAYNWYILLLGSWTMIYALWNGYLFPTAEFWGLLFLYCTLEIIGAWAIYNVRFKVVTNE